MAQMTGTGTGPTRPGPSRWPDVVIAVAVLGLFVGGLAALWGDELRRLAGIERATTPAPAVTPTPAAPTGAT